MLVTVPLVALSLAHLLGGIEIGLQPRSGCVLLERFVQRVDREGGELEGEMHRLGEWNAMREEGEARERNAMEGGS